MINYTSKLDKLEAKNDISQIVKATIAKAIKCYNYKEKSAEEKQRSSSPPKKSLFSFTQPKKDKKGDDLNKKEKEKENLKKKGKLKKKEDVKPISKNNPNKKKLNFTIKNEEDSEEELKLIPYEEIVKKYGFCIDLQNKNRKSLSAQTPEEDLEIKHLELSFDLEFLMNVTKENRIEDKNEEDFLEKMLRTKNIEKYKDFTPPFLDGKDLIFRFSDYQQTGKEYLKEETIKCVHDKVLDHFYDFSEENYYSVIKKESLL